MMKQMKVIMMMILIMAEMTLTQDLREMSVMMVKMTTLQMKTLFLVIVNFLF